MADGCTAGFSRTALGLLLGVACISALDRRTTGRAAGWLLPPLITRVRVFLLKLKGLTLRPNRRLRERLLVAAQRPVHLSGGVSGVDRGSPLRSWPESTPDTPAIRRSLRIWSEQDRSARSSPTLGTGGML